MSPFWKSRPSGPERTPLERRFWTHVRKPVKGDGCWEWTGHVNEGGYGAIGEGGRGGRMLLAHRVSWILHYGDIPDGLQVCHECDNRRCIRPDHLFLGTNQENQQDAARKGRKPSGANNPMNRYPERRPRGSDNGQSKLTDSDVLEIRRRYRAGESKASLARFFEVSEKVIYNIVLYKSWTHLP